jgi:flagellar secretion chaperone FliS
VIASSRATQAYRRVESESRSPLELVVMLYDGALRFLGEASAAAARGDLRARTQAISRVLAIVAELQSTLDLEKGGAVADQLDDLYTYITSRLLDVAIKKDATAIDEARKLLTPIRDAWSQVAAQPSMPQAVGAP